MTLLIGIVTVLVDGGERLPGLPFLIAGVVLLVVGLLILRSKMWQ